MSERRTVVLTGATSGVGRGVAETLLERNWRVVALVRSPGRADLSGLELVRCDVSSRDSVRRAANKVLERHPAIDVLLGCAGVAPWKRRESIDGFELTWATNILGHALLTELLKERLVLSAPSRVVMISGNAHRSATVHWDDLQLEQNYSAMNAGKQATLAKILWTYAMAREFAGTGVTVNTFCPAFVRSGLTRDFPGWLKPIVSLGHLFAQSARQGARTPVWLASSPVLETVSGKYFRRQAQQTSSPASLDREAQDRMLAQIREMIGYE